MLRKKIITSLVTLASITGIVLVLITQKGEENSELILGSIDDKTLVLRNQLTTKIAHGKIPLDNELKNTLTNQAFGLNYKSGDLLNVRLFFSDQETIILINNNDSEDFRVETIENRDHSVFEALTVEYTFQVEENCELVTGIYNQDYQTYTTKGFSIIPQNVEIGDYLTAYSVNPLEMRFNIPFEDFEIQLIAQMQPDGTVEYRATKDFSEETTYEEFLLRSQMVLNECTRRQFGVLQQIAASDSIASELIGMFVPTIDKVMQDIYDNAENLGENQETSNQ